MLSEISEPPLHVETEEPLGRDELATVISSDVLYSGDADDEGYDHRDARKGGSIESVSDGKIEARWQMSDCSRI